MSLSTFAFSMLGLRPRISKVNDCNGSLTTIFPCRPKADSAQVQLETPALNIFPPSIFCDVWATVYFRNLCLPLPEIMISLSSVTLSHDEPTIPLICLWLIFRSSINCILPHGERGFEPDGLEPVNGFTRRS